MKNPVGLYLVGVAVFWIIGLARYTRAAPKEAILARVGIPVWIALGLWGVWIALNPAPNYASGDTRALGDIIGLDRIKPERS